MALRKMFTPWSSLDNMLGKPPAWWPKEEQARIQSYEKYDQMYWNDPTQYSIRVLENEQPLYVPNARIIVDTTSQYLMKGLELVAVADGPVEPKTAEDLAKESAGKRDDRAMSPAQKSLENFLKREKFISKFHINKQAGVTRGDSAFHVTANPDKPEGSRISIDTLHPGQVFKVWDEDDPDKVIRIHIVTLWLDPRDDTEKVRKLTYSKGPFDADDDETDTRIWREEAIYELEGENGSWYGPKPTRVKTILEPEPLPDQITQFPVYWFDNINWESQDYGSSEIRGLEFLEWAVSQGATDTQMALALQGLGVYATDGGRPVDDKGQESDWEVWPGGVMEVPAGSYFRRVEGVGSIQPMMDQLKYLESKMYAATGMTDVALGQIDVQVAQSGIALAIKFMPTLARIEPRDIAQIETLQQMWFDLRFWFEAYDRRAMIPEVDVLIAKSKIPTNRVETLNELNNMYDRKIISRKFYREKMAELGYIIPADEDKTILEEAEMASKINALAAPPGLQENAEKAAAGQKPITNANGGNNEDVDKSGNQSNNGKRPNESGGTEATQTPARQAKP
jgi:hypothetical protein